MTVRDLICDEEVSEPPGYWHSHRCGNKARYIVLFKSNKQESYCGIHVKRWKRDVFETVDSIRELPA